MNFIHKNVSKNFSESEESLPSFNNEERFKDEKILEAIIFAAKEPVSIQSLKNSCPFIQDIAATIKNLIDFYSDRAINLVKIKNTYAFRTSPFYGEYVTQTVEKKVKLSKAAKETLSVIAYHQPVTRTEIEDIRGVSLYKGLISALLETNWVSIGPRRDSPGMPVTYVTTNDFLDYFGLSAIKDLPNYKELTEVGFSAGLKDDDFEI